MRKMIVSERITLDGIFDADTMEEWFNPYHSDDRAGYIQERILTSGAFVLGRTTMETTQLKLVKTKTFSLGVVLLTYQPVKNQ